MIALIQSIHVLLAHCQQFNTSSTKLYPKLFFTEYNTQQSTCIEFRKYLSLIYYLYKLIFIGVLSSGAMEANVRLIRLSISHMGHNYSNTNTEKFYVCESFYTVHCAITLRFFPQDDQPKPIKDLFTFTHNYHQ